MNDKPENVTEQIDDQSNDYLETIKQLKESTVPKEKYDKLKEENRKLLKDVVNGRTDEQAAPAPKPVDLNELRNSLFNSENSNLEYAKKALQLRKELMDQGKPDPFLPTGHRVQVTRQDEESAQRVADALEHCIEFANGDSLLFTNELQRITKDVGVFSGKRR